ncbi:MAG: GTPase HflX [Candidatus Cloacimonetes bacterium 4572_55]|nr:MAG: GTPase HflX [Candidatus Cloacimonetes bacterium 4572_55]
METILPKKKEQAVLVGVNSGRNRNIEDSMEELEQLVDTAGAEVVSKVVQNLNSIHPRTYIGKGKAEYVGNLLKELDGSVVIFDNDLTPAQNRNLEDMFDCKVLDRTAVILDIFALHARTNEARLQVELAQLQYALPRLTRLWVHLAGSQGGIGFRGPGETQLEVDRRLIGKRISDIGRKLTKVQSQHDIQRKARGDMLEVGLVGYTNAGKSTLLNALTDANVYVEDQLFATLDTTTRQINLDQNQKALISDTVGFIRNLPHSLIASFRATLAEVRLADLLIHLVDASHPNFRDHISAVNTILTELEAFDKPTLMVFNKSDKLQSEYPGDMDFQSEYPESLVISAKTGQGLAGLRERLLSVLESRLTKETFRIPQRAGHIVDMIHSQANVIKTEYEADSTLLTAELERPLADKIRKILNRNS